MKNGEASVHLEDVKRKPRNRALTRGGSQNRTRMGTLKMFHSNRGYPTDSEQVSAEMDKLVYFLLILP